MRTEFQTDYRIVGENDADLKHYRKQMVVTSLITDLYEASGIREPRDMIVFDCFPFRNSNLRGYPIDRIKMIEYFDLFEMNFCRDILVHLLYRHCQMGLNTYLDNVSKNSPHRLNRQFFIKTLEITPILSYKVLPLNPDQYCQDLVEFERTVEGDPFFHLSRKKTE